MDAKALETMEQQVDTAKQLSKSIQAMDKFIEYLNSDGATGMEIVLKFGAREEYPLCTLNPKFTLHKFKEALSTQAAALKSELYILRKTCYM